MARLSLQDAEHLAARGRPWTFRLEFHGANPANQGGFSSKYWYATGRGLTESVEIGWGACGAAPQLLLVDWTDLRTRVDEKLVKGYDYVSTVFVRMSPGNLAKIAGIPQVSGAPLATATPVTVAAPVQPTQGIKHTPSAVQTALGAPYSLVCALKLVRKGSQATGFDALDASGDYLFDFTLQGGRDFANEHNLDIQF